MEEKIQKFKSLIEKSNKILLINHIKMDPDAFWSLWALYYILKFLGKEIKATNDENTPSEFSFLWANEIIEKDLDLNSFDPDLIISLDAASESQLWEKYNKYKKLFKNKDFVVLDHHVTNKGFGSLNIIDPKSSSTCELLYYILEKIWYDKYLTKKEATLLTAWIHTDTNVFYNQNTTSYTLKVAAKLMELGADFRAPMYNFFQKSSYEKIKLIWVAFDKIKRSKNKKIIWTKLTKKDFENTNTSINDVSWIINRLINIDWCEIAFILSEDNNNVKASFRSKEYDVWSLAASFKNWWWHKLAAWFKTSDDINKTEKEILEKIK